MFTSVRDAVADALNRVPRPAVPTEGASWFGAGVVAAVAAFLGYELVVGPALAAQAAPTPPRPTPLPVRVHVSGEVAHPGTYDLPSTARVEDAVRLAGGPTEQGDVASVNQAAHLIDGQRVLVPRLRAPDLARPTAVVRAPPRADGGLVADASAAPDGTSSRPTPTPSYPTRTPWPTATPYPTRTPRATATAYSTRTPRATATAYPTRTARPTSTPYPTRTPFPTRTPYPTRTPRPSPTPYGMAGTHSPLLELLGVSDAQAPPTRTRRPRRRGRHDLDDRGTTTDVTLTC